MINTTKELVEKFNYLTSVDDIIFEVVEGLQSPEGERQYLQLYGPVGDDGNLLDLERIVMAPDIDTQTENIKLSRLIAYMVGILSGKIANQTDPYLVLSTAIEQYDEVKAKMENLLGAIQTSSPEAFEPVLKTWELFRNLYEWVNFNKNIINLDGGLSLTGRPHKLHIQTFNNMVNDCIEANLSVVLIETITIPED